MRVFLDVGAHVGQTLVAAMDPRFGFDRIVCFEPVGNCWPKLDHIAKSHRAASVRIERFGLWDRDCMKPVHRPGSKSAGMWAKDKDQGKSGETQACRFVCASTWFRKNIAVGDTVYLKLNVEGAECDILDDLLDSGEFDKVAFCMVDFDVRKIADLKHRQAEVMARLSGFGFPRVATSKQVMKGETHAERIKHWLDLCR